MTWLKRGMRIRKRKDSLHESRCGEIGTVVRHDGSSSGWWVEWENSTSTRSSKTFWEKHFEEIMTDKKDTNPKDGIGLTKAALSCMPLPGLLEGALAMMEGALKYGRHNYRVAGVRYSVYFDAMIRHLFAWFEGEERATDSGVHHLGHVMACCAILLDDILAVEPIGNDDRPPAVHNSAWLPEFNRRVAELKARYPNPVPPNTEL